MAMTATERVRAVRERRRRREIQLTVVLHQDDLGEIARRGYEGRGLDRSRAPGRSGPALDHRRVMGITPLVRDRPVTPLHSSPAA
jgi:hypothetical protein